MQPDKWTPARDRALRLGDRGAIMPTGIETLDKATRGGLRAGGIVILGGAPGAGKTTFAVQLARHYAQAGHPVGLLACDEDANGLLIRWGQQSGLERGDLERGDRAACSELALGVGDLLLVDQDEDVGATVETVAERLAAMTQGTGRAGVLVVDSVQTARTTANDADGIRERTTQTVNVLKSVAKIHGLLVIATSEMARSNYRGGRDKATVALASFKESGGIEYGATVALALVAISDDLVGVQNVKCRIGRKLPVHLQLDHDRALFVEVAGNNPKAERRAAKVAELAELMFARLAELPEGVIGARGLADLVVGRSDDKAAARLALVNAKRITGGGHGVPYRVAESEAAQ